MAGGEHPDLRDQPDPDHPRRAVGAALPGDPRAVRAGARVRRHARVAPAARQQRDDARALRAPLAASCRAGRQRAAGRAPRLAAAGGRRAAARGRRPGLHDGCHLPAPGDQRAVSGSPAYVETPAQAQVVSADGPRPFVTHVRYRLADGRLLDWASRRHRKRPGALGRWIAVLFMIGSACFVAGSMAGYSTLVGARADAVTYFVGSIFFTSAAYLQYVECINADRKALPDAGRRRRLLAIEVRRIDWWATTVQLLGTLFFNVTTFTALDAHLNAKQSDLVVWTPDALGSICFLVASQLAYAEAGHAWVSWRPSDAGWRIAALNMLGSIFFGISAIAGWVQPSTGDLLDAALDTSGTFWGAVCFFAGAALLLRADTTPTSEAIYVSSAASMS